MRASRDFRDEIAIYGRRGRSFLTSGGRPGLTGDAANRSAFESSQQVSASLHGYDGFTVVAILLPLVAVSASLKAFRANG